ncbi:MAG: glycosyltransferase family 87 protein [Paracoccaceae bacterium]
MARPGDPDPAAARLAVFRGAGWARLCWISAGLTLLAGGAVFGLYVPYLASTEGEEIRIDFMVFWGAAQLALAGDPVGTLDREILGASQAALQQDWLPWVYPPGFLLAVAPLGLLPFWAAWTVFAWGSVLAFVAALRPFAGGVTPLLLGIAFAPGILTALILGQTTLWWFAGLLAALAALRRRKEVLAGVLIGLLTLKPQLGLLIPVALIAGGYWRAVAAASVTALGLAALGTAVVGWNYWPALAEAAAVHRDFLVAIAPDNQLMISPYALMAGIGVPHGPAIGAQWALSAAAALAVFLVWRRAGGSFDLRVAVLVAGIAVATPYFWYYEGAVLAVISLFLWRAGTLGPGPLAALLTVAFWLGPTPMILLDLLNGPEDAPLRETVVPLALLAFALAVTGAVRDPAARAGANG